ncbi:AaceriABR167Cp [[Ashbya] aceris (nom. inval.)]|nr:AaceriABR167Cp [[Ashbya] aceris (nom. inval.)]
MGKRVLQCVPVLHPTEDEFRDPIGYLSKASVQRLGHVYGMVKLVPPCGFQPPMTVNDDVFRFHVRLQTLSELGLLNRSRLFFMRQLNNFMMAEGRRRRQLLQLPYADAGGQRVYLYDLFIEVLKFYSGEPAGPGAGIRKRRRGHSDIVGGPQLTMQPLDMVLSDTALWRAIGKLFRVSASSVLSIFTTKISKYYRFLQKQSRAEAGSSFIKSLIYQDELPKSLIHDDSSEESDSDSDVEDDCVICQKRATPARRVVCKTCRNFFHRACVQAPPQDQNEGIWICNNCIVGNGYYGFKEEEHLYTRAEFKAQCAEYDAKHFPEGKPLDNISLLEDKFWDLVHDVENRATVKYGADIHNEGPGVVTAFPTLEWVPPHIRKGTPEYEAFLRYVEHPMNLLNLPMARGSLLPVFGRSISGMTVPWLYIGSTFSTFCWHLEDQYTLSANYQHEGDPKVWYSIPEQSAAAFNKLMKNIAPDLFEKQPDLMHQLVTLISPYDEKFEAANIACYKAVQHPGEYIITYPKCYHAGFNTGYNFNEAVNFTLDLWVPYGLCASQDYRLTGKRCVFDMWELMLNVLLQYLAYPHTHQEALIRRCHLELQNIFRSEMKYIQLLKGITHRDDVLVGSRELVWAAASDREPIVKDEPGSIPAPPRPDTSDSGDDLDSNECEVFCTKCSTICPFAFVVHYPRGYSRKRRKYHEMNPSKWNRLAAKGSISIFCLVDYVGLLESIDSEEESSDSSAAEESSYRNFEDDELYYIRHPDDINRILQTTERKLDSCL